LFFYILYSTCNVRFKYTRLLLIVRPSRC